MRSSELPIAWEQPPGHQAVLDMLQALLELHRSPDASRLLPMAP